MTTYYDILGVGPRAGADEIKSAHRRLAKKFHPDRTLGADTAVRRSLEDRFRDIQEAYDTLRDKVKRTEYDDMLAMLNSGEYYEPLPPPLPTVTLTANPRTVEKGQLVTISWTSQNATDLRLDLGTGMSRVGSHGCEFVRLQDSTTFTLTAKGPGGTARATASVAVIIPEPSPPAPSPQKRQFCWNCHGPFPLGWENCTINFCVYCGASLQSPPRPQREQPRPPSPHRTNPNAGSNRRQQPRPPSPHWTHPNVASNNGIRLFLSLAIFCLCVFVAFAEILGHLSDTAFEAPIHQESPAAGTKVPKPIPAATPQRGHRSAGPSTNNPVPSSAGEAGCAWRELGNKLGYVRDSCKSGVTSVEVANNRPKAEQREVDTPAASGEPSNSRPPVEFITNGSSKADVRRIQGTPTSLTDAEWDYGPSSVYFSNGRVVGWRNHPDTPLKARISRPGALGLNTNNDSAHVQFGVALGNKGDWDGAIAEYREALRLNPNNDVAHTKLGVALADKGDWDGAIAEYHEALHLNPKNDVAHANLGWVLGEKGDLDGAIAEYREALLLNPKNDIAHANLAWVLRDKGDWDGAIAEYREKLRQNPNSGNAHFLLGMVLERKGNDQEALREYRAAHLLDPQNPAYREGYERLSKRLNQ